MREARNKGVNAYTFISCMNYIQRDVYEFVGQIIKKMHN